MVKQAVSAPERRWRWRAIRAHLDELGGHKVAFASVVAADGAALGPIAFCQACGAFFWRRVGSLSRPCGGAKPYGQLALLRKGRFPETSARYKGRRVEAVGPGRPSQVLQLRQQLCASGGSAGPSLPVRRRLGRKTGPTADAAAAASDRSSLLGRYGLCEASLATAVAERLAARRRLRTDAGPPERFGGRCLYSNCSDGIDAESSVSKQKGNKGNS